MKNLENGYSFDFIPSEKEPWHRIMRRFQDANLYQSWPYDVLRFGHKNVVHAILRKNNETVAAAQVRIYRLPSTNFGIAYTLWGPMWRRYECAADPDVFRQAIRGLRNEFSKRRGLVLRIYPLAFAGEYNGSLKLILADEGYHLLPATYEKRTLLIDLKPSLEELRAGLHQKWRNCLNKAEKIDLKIITGEDDAIFDEISELYNEMLKRKGLDDPNDIGHLKKVQQDLPGDYRLKAVVCRQNGTACAGAIFTRFGDTGVYLRGATNDAGMKTNGSYLVQWNVIKWLKENKFRYYDLNGINREINPGTYRFKTRLAGKNGKELAYLGKYQTSKGWLSSFLVGTGERFLNRYRNFLKR